MADDKHIGHGRQLLDLAKALAPEDPGEQLNAILHAVSSFAAQYEGAAELLTIAIDALTAARNAVREFRAAEKEQSRG